MIGTLILKLVKRFPKDWPLSFCHFLAIYQSSCFFSSSRSNINQVTQIDSAFKWSYSRGSYPSRDHFKRELLLGKSCSWGEASSVFLNYANTDSNLIQRALVLGLCLLGLFAWAYCQAKLPKQEQNEKNKKSLEQPPIIIFSCTNSILSYFI